MNIQINCKEDVKEDDLRFIYHNLPNLIEEYELKKNSSLNHTYKNGKLIYAKKLEGSSFVNVNIEMTCNGKMMYFKIK